MKKILFLITAFAITCCGAEKEVIGKYRTKHSYYGMFANTIELKQDGSLVKNFQGDMMNDNSFGTWTRHHDTLTLLFDTLHYPAGRYKGPEKYIIEKHRLKAVTVSKAQLQLMEVLLRSSDTLTRAQQRKYLRMLRNPKVPTDFKGTLRENYYVRIK